MNYVIDTHVLFWYLFSPEKLSKEVDKIIADIERDGGDIIVPVIVLAEMMFLLEKKNIGISIEDMVEKIDQSAAFSIASFDKEQLIAMSEFPEIPEMHDRMIAAAALSADAAILTKDRNLKTIKGIRIVW